MKRKQFRGCYQNSPRLIRFILVVLIALIYSTFVNAADTSRARSAVLLDVRGVISPAYEDYIEKGLAFAARQQAALVILRLDTPGGLSSSTRAIVRAILASSVPVVGYVAPSGARASSAGTYILYACHLAAMAPGTHLGAATPIQMGGAGSSKQRQKSESASERKAVSDAAAYIRGLAELRGRNSAWAEKAVRQAVSLTAEQALQEHVINAVAADVPALLQALNQKTVKLGQTQRTLNTKNLTVETFAPNWRVQFLAVITAPEVAYLLLLIAIYGIFFEFANPGFVLPGVVGVIALMLALYAFHLLPVNYAGLGLIAAGIAFLVLEAFIPSFGVLGIGGIVAFVIGSILLLQPENLLVVLPFIIGAGVVTALFFLLVINLALRARFKPVVSGGEQLLGMQGVITKDEQGRMRILLQGEWWQVKAGEPLQDGQLVKVIGREGLVLIVQPVSI